jgi:phosphoribosylamine--glycine ligase
MQVLLIGAGAREHSLAVRLLESPVLDKLYWLPGNAALEGRVNKVRSIDSCDGPRLAIWARRQAIDLAVIGPEEPLLAGVADCLEEVGVPCFGPYRAAARLEGSKIFAKDLLTQAGVPTARYTKVAGPGDAQKVLKDWPLPLVIKADGLAAGKGVRVAMTREQAQLAAASLEGPGIIEEYLEGRELSYLVLAQGREFVALVPSQDHKRAGDGDTGANTGGMGALAGFGLINQRVQQEISCTIIKPTLAALAGEGIAYKGVLYAGLMLTDQGPKVLEFNVRFGDPETQAILQLWEDDLLAVMNTVARGGLPPSLLWSQDWALSLVLASGGYPGPYKTGFVIQGLEEAKEHALVYQAGTKLAPGGIVTAGGRVLTLAAKGSLELAREKVYAAAAKIRFPGLYYRRDI